MSKLSNKLHFTYWKQKIQSGQKPLSDYSRQASRQTLFQYALCLILFPFVGIALFLLCFNLYAYYRNLTDDSSSIIFWLAQIFRETLFIWVVLVCVVGWLVITWHFVCKPFRYLDEVISAAEALVSSSDTPVKLSPALKSTQDNLNLAREKALRNALLAKEAEQRKNDLIVYLAHDLKTPLTSVIGYLTLLRDEPEISPALQARYTRIALDKAERLEDLTNEFFEITRFNLTSLTLQKERINLSRMLEQICSEFLPLLAEKELSWQTAFDADVEYLCDPDKLERVFDNLIRNAVNYSYSGTAICFSLKKEETYLRITIRNQGKTIPPDKLGRIFEQFFRLDSSRASSTGGAGLGLAIAKEIVELHGGTITAASEAESIVFTVSLPISELS